MNSSNQNTAEVKPATSEAAVYAYLREQHKAQGLPEWATLCATSDSQGIRCYGYPPDAIDFVHATGETVAEAVANFRDKLPPSGPALAQLKREQAAKLIAEADKIEAVGAAPRTEEGKVAA